MSNIGLPELLVIAAGLLLVALIVGLGFAIYWIYRSTHKPAAQPTTTEAAPESTVPPTTTKAD